MSLSLRLNAPLQALFKKTSPSPVHQALKALKQGTESGAYGFVDLIRQPQAWAPLTHQAQRLRLKCQQMVVLGIGGSSLGGQALATALAPYLDRRLLFLDNIDPEIFCRSVDSLDWKTTSVYLVSKSGSTLETWAQWAYVFPRLQQENPQWRQSVAVCTGPEMNDLRRFAQENELPTWTLPSSVGGRYSVLSSVGLFPLAFASEKFSNETLAASLQHAQTAIGLPAQFSEGTLPFQLTHAIHAAHQAGYADHVLMPYSALLDQVADWFIQLWAESLGKKREQHAVGSTPLKARGVTDQHSLLQLLMQGPATKLVGFIDQTKRTLTGALDTTSLANFPSAQCLHGKTLEQILKAELYGTEQALEEVGRPTYHLEMKDTSLPSLASLLYLYECVTALTGLTWGINPFDQPGVERGKIITKELLKNS